MALSNIFREPRREITESVMGIAIFLALLWPDYRFALWFQDLTGGPERGVPVIMGLFAGATAGAACVALLFFTHFVGEEVCEWLDDRGLRLRPRNRR